MEPERFAAYEEMIESSIMSGNTAGAFFDARQEAFPDLKRKLNKTKYLNILNYLENAVAQDMLLCTTKLWDTSRSALSIPNLIHEYDWDRLRIDLEGDRFESQRLAAIESLQETSSDFLASDVCRALLVSRAEGFAHAIPASRERKKMSTERLAQNADVDVGLAKAASVWKSILHAVRSTSTDYSFSKRQMRQISLQFYRYQPDLNSRRRRD